MPSTECRIASSPSQSAEEQCDYRWLLFVILCGGIAMRSWGIWFRHGTWDEAQIISGARCINRWLYTLLTGHTSPGFIEPQIVTIYGIFSKYLAVPPCAVAAALHDIYLAKVLTRIVVSLIPSIATLFVVLRLCAHLSASKVLSVGALLLTAFAFEHVKTAHFAVADSLSAFLVTACLLYLSRWAAQPGNTRNLVISAVLAATAASTKINIGGCLLLTILGTTMVGSGWFERNPLRTMRLLVVSVLAFGLAFVLINLPYLLHWRIWMDVIALHLTEMDNSTRWHCLYYLCMTPALGMGGAIAAIVVAGLLTSFQRKHIKTIYPLLIFTVLFYTFLSMASCAVHRWIIPAIPVFAILGGMYVESMYGWLARRSGRGVANIVIAVVLLLAIAPSAYHIALFDLNLTERETTYLQVERFVESQNPEKKWLCGIGELTAGLARLCRFVQFCPPTNIVGLADADVSELESGKYDYAVLCDFRHPLKRPFPEFLLCLGEKQRHDFELMEYIRNHWVLEAEYKSKYYTPWTNDLARQPIFWVYRAPKNCREANTSD